MVVLASTAAAESDLLADLEVNDKLRDRFELELLRSLET